jgi:hypothetical protein
MCLLCEDSHEDVTGGREGCWARIMKRLHFSIFNAVEESSFHRLLLSSCSDERLPLYHLLRMASSMDAAAPNRPD